MRRPGRDVCIFRATKSENPRENSRYVDSRIHHRLEKWLLQRKYMPVADRTSFRSIQKPTWTQTCAGFFSAALIPAYTYSESPPAKSRPSATNTHRDRNCCYRRPRREVNEVCAGGVLVLPDFERAEHNGPMSSNGNCIPAMG